MDKNTIINIDDTPLDYNKIYFWTNPADETVNAIVKFGGKLTRLRAGLLLIRNNDEILLAEEEDDPGVFSLPGGGLEPGETIAEAAERECNEEVFLKAKNVKETGHDYCECYDIVQDWVKERVPEKYQWYNYYTCLCIGEYAGKYKDEVDPEDLDISMKNSAKFYKIADVIDAPSFKEQWKKALIDFGYSDLTEGLADDAKKYFGLTTNPSVCFYINTDGTMLDGSGKNFGSDGRHRTIDHRDIAQIIPEASDGNDAMLAYMREGNIRYMPETCAFDMIERPTQVQLDTMQRIIRRSQDEVFVDISAQNGDTIESFVFPEGGANEAVAQIKDYFDNKLTESIEDEKTRIKDVIDVMAPVKYGFISKQTGEEITDRDWIHNTEDLGNYYEVNRDPRVTLQNKLGICQDQAIAIKYLMNKYHPEDEVKLFALTKEPKGHCVACYCHAGKWYYLETAWDKERGLHGPFSSLDALKKYLKTLYKVHHSNDTPADSKVELTKYTEPSKAQDILLEDTRSQMVAKSRNADLYKHPVRGKNRFERKRFSKVAQYTKQFNNIDMNKLFKQDMLILTIPVQGETDNYDVTIQLDGVTAEIQRAIKANHNMLEYKTIVQAVTKIFNTTNIRVKCTCDDFKYRFAHQLIVNNNSVDDTAHDPGPGSTGMANTTGKGCKHILLCLNNADWIMKISSCIKNYIFYAEGHIKPAFDKLIFPKLYGVPISAAEETGLVPEDTNLATDKTTIETINDWAKNRGKYVKGSNKNVAQGKMQGPSEEADQTPEAADNTAKKPIDK